MKILCSPYEEPNVHLAFDPVTMEYAKNDGRREAGYWRLNTTKQGSKRKKIDKDKLEGIDEQIKGKFIKLPMVGDIRNLVREWRECGYEGATDISVELLKYWHNNEEEHVRSHKFFFCQLEAIETLIWLTEINPTLKDNRIFIKGDGGPFTRYCSKMATGTGKTVVMAMLIAWQSVNAAKYKDDTRFNNKFLLVAPSKVVRDRLDVLVPYQENNYYDEFDIVPDTLKMYMSQVDVVVENWHTLQWDNEADLAKRKGVDKRGKKTDKAYVRDILKKMDTSSGINVINDEGHHAWRSIEDKAISSEIGAYEKKQATQWINGLDRLHGIIGINMCFDFSATPFIPASNPNSEDYLFNWIVSDFSLSDAIESRLVKTPVLVTKDDTSDKLRSSGSGFYHIFDEEEVNHEFTRPDAKEQDGLPDLVRNGYVLLLKDWSKTRKEWLKKNAPTPPTMITVTNRTSTAGRVYNAFALGDINQTMKPDELLRIDTKTEKVLTESQRDDKKANILRKMVSTIGQEGGEGEGICHVISVNMLTEGWDAKTVTHIMGLRAFRSQLLCEQVIGRGLRRASYELMKDNMFKKEHVKIFGVPFALLPHEYDGSTTGSTAATVDISPLPEREAKYSITFPNVKSIQREIKQDIVLDWKKIEPYEIDANGVKKMVLMTQYVDGGGIPTSTSSNEEIITIDSDTHRSQTTVFRIARQLLVNLHDRLNVSKPYLFARLVQLVEEIIDRGYLRITPPSLFDDETQQQQILDLSVTSISNYLKEAIDIANTERLTLTLNHKPLLSTSNMRRWKTIKETESTKKSHINRVVLDSGWEGTVAKILDEHPKVIAWVKNDHIGLKVGYMDQNKHRNYIPDFIIRLDVNDSLKCNLVLEVKGQDDNLAKIKQMALREWTEAVNSHGGFGIWKAVQVTNVSLTNQSLQEAIKWFETRE